MAKLKLIGAVAVKVRPDTDGFHGKAKREINDALKGIDPDITIDVEVDADTKPARAGMKKLKRDLEGQEVEIRFEPDYDSLRGARQKVDRMLGKLKEKVEVIAEVDEPSLRRVRDKIDRLTKESKVKINFNEDEAGYRRVLDKIRDIQREKAEIEIELDVDDASLEAKRKEMEAKLKVTAKVEADRKSAAVAGKQMEDQLKKNRFVVQVAPDYDSIKAALARTEEALGKLKERTINVKADEASLLRTKAKLDALLKDADLKVKMVPDERGYTELLARIRSIQREKREIKFDLKTDDDSLARMATDLETKLKALVKPVKVEYKVTDDKAGWAELRGKLEDLKRERLKVKVDVEMNDAAIDAALLDAHNKLASFSRGTTAAELRVRLHSMDLRHAEHEAKKLKDKIDRMSASLQITTSGAATAAAHIAYVARTRIVDLFVKVNRKSLIVAEGLLKSLAGINTLNSAGRLLESLFVKFDKVALAVTAVSTLVGSLANVALYAASALLSIGGGIAQSVGLLATAPAMVTALSSAVVVYLAAFKNFKGAIDGNAEAMAALPPSAQAAATALQGVWTAIQKPIQERFWDGMGTSIQDAVTHGLDPLRVGLANTGEAFGKFTAGVLNSFTKIAEDDQLGIMFDNLALGMHNMSSASEPFFDAFNKLGFEGSKFLPRFGTWMTELATTFDNWITRSRDAGKITEWIEHGVHSLENMWGAAGSTINIFKALTRAANDAGATGLAGFARRLESISKTMLAEPFQSQMSAIFEGAHKGAGHLNTGMKDLGRTFTDSAVWTGKLLDNLGLIGGELMTNLAILTNGKVFQSGTMKGLEGMIELLDELKPGFKDLGSIIGNLSTVAGSIFGSIGTTLSSVVRLLDQAVGIMVKNISDIAPRLLGSITSIVTAITPTVLALAGALNGVLGFINKMPAGLGIAAGSLAAFLALRGLFGSFYKGFANTGAFKAMENNWRQQQAMAGNANAAMQKFKFGSVAFQQATGYARNLTGGLRDMNTMAQQVNLSRLNSQLGAMGPLTRAATRETGRVSALAGAFARLGADTRGGVGMTNRLLGGLGTTTQASTRLATNSIAGLNAAIGTINAAGMGVVKAGMGGLMGALGGPWGLALAAAGIGIALFAQSQQKAKAHIESLTMAIDDQTGKLDASGVETITKAWTDLDEAGSKMANFWRGFKGAKAANETAADLGLSLEGITKSIVDGGPAYDSMIGNLEKLGKNMQLLEGPERDRRGMNYNEIKDGAEAAAAALGYTVAELEAMGIEGASVTHLAKNIREQGDAAKLAAQINRDLGVATGQTSVAAGQMAEAMKQIGDESQTAASKIGAINKALDLLKGGQLSAREAVVAAQSAQQAAVEQAKGLAEQIANNGGLLRDVNGMIDITSATGLGLQQAMAGSADGIKISAMAAYQAAEQGGATAAESWAAAKEILNGGDAALQQIATGAGTSVEILKKEWEGFFGTDFELQAVFSASADKFQAVKEGVEAEGVAFDQKVFQAFLDANGDPAKISVEQAKAWAKQYALDTYEAQITASNDASKAKVAEARENAQALADQRFTPTIDADGNPIAAKLTEADIKAQALANKPIVPKVDADPSALNTKVEAADAKAQALANKPIVPVVDANTEAAIAKLGDTKARGDELGLSMWAPTVDVDGNASGVLATTLGMLAQIPSSVLTTHTIQTVREGGVDGKMTGGQHTSNADGGLKLRGQSARGALIPSTNIRNFADGGFSFKPRSAHIARAGSYVTYAEEETGGEAFIPLAASKRKRSMAIWKETGKRLGAQHFANGAVTGPSSSAPTINVTNHYPVAEKTSVTVNRSLQFAGAISPS